MIHTSDDMARQLPTWGKIIIASALSLFAGFGAGTWITLSERTALKKEIVSLNTEVETVSRAISDAEIRNTKTAANLGETNSRLSERDHTISELTGRIVQLYSAQAAVATAPEGSLGTQAEPSSEALAAKDRTIASLQGEIAALQKRIADMASIGGQRLPDTEPIQAPRASVSEPSQSKGQCTATTKKGARCKRTARSGGRCWQHGG